MKVLAVLAVIVSHVLAVSIPEDVFNIFYVEGQGSVMLERGSFLTGNLTRIPANLTFTNRTIANTTIVDSYTIHALGEDVGNATRTISARPGFGVGGFGFLEIRFRLSVEEVTPAAMEALVIDADTLKISSVDFFARNVNVLSSVQEIISQDTAITWTMYPPVGVYGAFTDLGRDFVDPTFFPSFQTFNRLFLRVFVIPAPVIEIIFIGVPPCERPLITAFDQEVIIVADPGIPATTDDTLDVDGDIEDEIEDEIDDADLDDIDDDDDTPLGLKTFKVVKSQPAITA